jgi:hypothetical protein
MDIPTLLTGVEAGCQLSEDTPDYCSLLHHLLTPSTSPKSLGAPPTIPELAANLTRGSNASSLDELPRRILEHLPGHGVLVLHNMIERLSAGSNSELLNSVLHLPLQKKEPAWLLRNSRPVLLEPFLKRCEATALASASSAIDVGL